jgi:hypothetical protein
VLRSLVKIYMAMMVEAAARQTEVRHDARVTSDDLVYYNFWSVYCSRNTVPGRHCLGYLGKVPIIRYHAFIATGRLE